MPTIDIHINSDCEKYELVFLLNKEDKPFSISLDFMDNKGYAKDSWDSEAYLDTLDKYISAVVNKEQVHPDWMQCFYDIMEVKGMVEDLPSIHEIFNKARDLGLWK